MISLMNNKLVVVNGSLFPVCGVKAAVSMGPVPKTGVGEIVPMVDACEDAALTSVSRARVQTGLRVDRMWFSLAKLLIWAYACPQNVRVFVGTSTSAEGMQKGARPPRKQVHCLTGLEFTVREHFAIEGELAAEAFDAVAQRVGRARWCSAAADGRLARRRRLRRLSRPAEPE